MQSKKKGLWLLCGIGIVLLAVLLVFLFRKDAAVFHAGTPSPASNRPVSSETELDAVMAEPRTVKGIVADLSPLRIYSPGEDEILELSALPSRFAEASDSSVVLGTVLTVTFTEMLDTGPRRLEKISAVEMGGAASEEEYQEAEKKYGEFLQDISDILSAVAASKSK